MLHRRTLALRLAPLHESLCKWYDPHNPMGKLYRQKYTEFLGDGRKKPSTVLDALNKYAVSGVNWLLYAHSSYVLVLTGWCLCIQKWFAVRRLPVAAITSKQMIYDFFWWLLDYVKHLKTGNKMVTRSFKWIRQLAYYHGYVTRADWPGYKHDEEFERIKRAVDSNNKQLVLRTGNKRTDAERTAMKLSDINKVADVLAWGQSRADDIIQLMAFISLQTQTLMRPPQMCDLLRLNLKLQNTDNYMSLAGGVQVLEMGSNQHKITLADTYTTRFPCSR